MFFNSSDVSRTSREISEFSVQLDNLEVNLRETYDIGLPKATKRQNRKTIQTCTLLEHFAVRYATSSLCRFILKDSGTLVITTSEFAQRAAT